VEEAAKNGHPPRQAPKKQGKNNISQWEHISERTSIDSSTKILNLDFKNVTALLKKASKFTRS